MNFLGKNIEKIVIFGLRLRSIIFAHLSYLSMASTRGHRGVGPGQTVENFSSCGPACCRRVVFLAKEVFRNMFGQTPKKRIKDTIDKYER